MTESAVYKIWIPSWILVAVIFCVVYQRGSLENGTLWWLMVFWLGAFFAMPNVFLRILFRRNQGGP